MWKIFSYATNRGEKPVREFFEKQDMSTRSKIDRNLRLLAEYGVYLKMPHVKRLTNEIYELRIRGKQEIRILYCFISNKIYLLHAFKKQTQETPSREIRIANNRFELLT